jgi:excisionase family DNA binding protein
MVDNDSPLSERFYSPKQVAEPLGVKERVILDLLRSGKLRGVKIGKFWRIPESALRAYMSRSGQVKSEAPPDSGGEDNPNSEIGGNDNDL